MTKTPKTQTDAPSVKGYRIVTVTSDEEAEAVKEVASREGINVASAPDFVAMWTGDVERFDAERDRAVIVEFKKDGSPRLNAFPELEKSAINFIKDRYKFYGGATTVVDPDAENFHEYNEAEGLAGRLVLLGDAEKFENGGEFHAMAFTRIVMQRSETAPEDEPETFEEMRTLYRSGLECCNALRERNGYTGGK